MGSVQMKLLSLLPGHTNFQGVRNTAPYNNVTFNMINKNATNPGNLTGNDGTATALFGFGLGTPQSYVTNPLGKPPYADLTEATAATINQFRQAIMMQSLLELDARGGTRYVEILKAHFNVISPDFRLQRPEFLGGGSTTINQHPVAQICYLWYWIPIGKLTQQIRQ